MTIYTKKQNEAYYKARNRACLAELAEMKQLGLDNRDAAYRAAVRSGFYTQAAARAQATPAYVARLRSAYRWVVRQAGVLALILSSLLWITHIFYPGH